MFLFYVIGPERLGILIAYAQSMKTVYIYEIMSYAYHIYIYHILHYIYITYILHIKYCNDKCVYNIYNNIYISIVHASSGPCTSLAKESGASGKSAQVVFALSTTAARLNAWPSVLPAMWISEKSTYSSRGISSLGIGGFISASFVKDESKAASTAGTIFH